MIRHIALAVGLGLTAPVAALAQTADAPEAQPQAPQTMDSAATYQAARNQLGILKYCNAEGYSGEEAIESQAKLVGMLPGEDEEAGAAAEQKGEAGTVSIGEAEMSLEDAAASQNSNVEETCKQIEAAVNQVAPTMPAG